MDTTQSKNMLCQICISNYNKKNIAVACPYCSNECCVSCFKTYLMSSDTTYPVCMFPSCKKEISLDFITSVTPNSFHNDVYRKKRTSIIISREESLLPTRQNLVQNEMRKRKAIEDKKVNSERINELKTQLRELMLKNNALSRIIAGIEDTKEEEIERRTFVKNCPVNDCRGYLSAQWKCGICEVYVCKDCHIVKTRRDDDEHKCDKELVESISMINKESKPCPVCGIPISKIDGCDQMWCVTCKTPWSWNTGRVDKGSVHNPHYYEWLRNSGKTVPRARGDVPICEQIVNVDQLRYSWNRLSSQYEDEGIDIERLPAIIGKSHMLSTHILHVELPRYPYVRHDIDGNSDLSVKYMMKEIDYEGWNSEIKKREKNREKKCDYYHVFRMISTAINDLMLRFCSARYLDVCEEIFAELESLREYSNNSFRTISTKYKSVIITIDNEWRIKTLKKPKKNE